MIFDIRFLYFEGRGNNAKSQQKRIRERGLMISAFLVWKGLQIFGHPASQHITLSAQHSQPASQLTRQLIHQSFLSITDSNSSASITFGYPQKWPRGDKNSTWRINITFLTFNFSNTPFVGQKPTLTFSKVSLKLSTKLTSCELSL